MENILTYILQVNLLLALVFLGYYFLLKNLTFYVMNRIYFLVGALYAVVYPLIDFKSWLVKDTLVGVPVLWDYISLEYVDQLSQSYSLYDVLLFGIVAGITVFVIKLFIQLLSLLRVHLYSNDAKWHNYLFRDVLFPVVPFSFFNKIYLHQAQHQDAELNDIFEHETIHVNGLHTWDVLLFEVLLVGCWYNPFVWLIRNVVRQNLEFLTDQQVLNKGVDRQTYQYSLLNVTNFGRSMEVGSQFNFKALKKRISMMNKKRSSKLELSKYVFLLPVMLLAGASFTVSQAESKIEHVVELTKETPIFNKVGSAQTKEEIKLEIRTKEEEKSITISSNENRHPSFSQDTLVIEGKRIIRLGPKKTYDELYVDEKPLILLDGEELEKGRDIRSINPNNILSIHVFKGNDSIHEFGDRGKNGVIFITTRKSSAIQNVPVSTRSDKSVDGLVVKSAYTEEVEPNEVKILSYKGKGETMARQSKATVAGPIEAFVQAKKPLEGQISFKSLSEDKNPLIIVDGVEVEKDFDLKQLNPNNIDSITVMKDAALVGKYGEKGANGVLFIKTKGSTKHTKSMMQ